MTYVAPLEKVLFEVPPVNDDRDEDPEGLDEEISTVASLNIIRFFIIFSWIILNSASRLVIETGRTRWRKCPDKYVYGRDTDPKPFNKEEIKSPTAHIHDTTSESVVFSFSSGSCTTNGPIMLKIPTTETTPTALPKTVKKVRLLLFPEDIVDDGLSSFITSPNDDDDRRIIDSSWWTGKTWFVVEEDTPSMTTNEFCLLLLIRRRPEQQQKRSPL